MGAAASALRHRGRLQLDAGSVKAPFSRQKSRKIATVTKAPAKKSPAARNVVTHLLIPYRRRRCAAGRNPTPHGRTCGAAPTLRARPNFLVRSVSPAARLEKSRSPQMLKRESTDRDHSRLRVGYESVHRKAARASSTKTLLPFLLKIVLSSHPAGHVNRRLRATLVRPTAVPPLRAGSLSAVACGPIAAFQTADRVF